MAAPGSPSTPLVQDVLRSPGKPLDPATRSFVEPRLGQDFSGVRVHTDAQAAASARAMSANAYTVGRDIVFSESRFAPETPSGLRLLAHELAHVVQQDGGRFAPSEPSTKGVFGPSAEGAEREARASADAILAGQPTRLARRPDLAGSLQRDDFRSPTVSVRSPVFEETVTQLSSLMPARSLSRPERELVQGVFGASVDYTRVRLIPTSILEYRTVANSIRVPENFSVANAEMAQTLVHEMTHVWQYQHSGTSYLSISLGSQIAASISGGNRNFAYDYQIEAGNTFFDFSPEQQATLVENYFAMQRDQAQIPLDQAAGNVVTYNSVHFGSDGFPTRLSAADRLAEIARELPLHEPLIQQMRAALPRPEVNLLLMRATEVMQVPGAAFAPVPRDLELTPVRPLLEIRFPGL